MQTASKQAKIVKKISLRLILVIPFVLQIFAAVGLTGYFSFKNGQKAVNNLVGQLMDKTSQQVSGHLDNYLALPVQLTQMNLQAIANGDLDINNPIKSERYFWQKAKVFKKIAYTGYSLQDGREVGAGRWIQGADVLIYENLPGIGKASDYTTDAKGNRSKRLYSYDYDPLSESWYKQLVAARKVTWTRTYISHNQNIEVFEPGTVADSKSKNNDDINNGFEYYVGVSVGAPFYDKNGKLLGITSADFLVTDISKFLHRLNTSQRGQIFIIDREGLLIGSSSKYPILHQVNDTAERYSALNSPDRVISSIGNELQKRFKNFQHIQGEQKLEINLNQESYFVRVKPWRDEYGLDWLVVITVPESDFMAEINAHNRTSIFLCFASLVIAIFLGLFTANWIIKPIQRLTKASQAISAGETHPTIDQSIINELNVLSESFNGMAEQLRLAFSALEETNQKLSKNNSELETRVTQRTEELSKALQELQKAQTQLVQTEKMSALGQMIAGIAHEINNPVSFIYGNLHYLNCYTQDIIKVLATYQNNFPHPPSVIQELIDEIDLDFLIEDLSKILKSMQVGTERIQEIVISLRNFSRLDEAEFKEANIHSGIDSTLMILQHRLKAQPKRPEIKVIKEYGKLPLVKCYAGQLNQVFMNILTNAIDALEESCVSSEPSIVNNKPTIFIHTCLTEDNILISIADNGVGIPKNVRSKLFDPFFTTKPTGKGTGLGLSISYQIIVEKHGGKLWFDSKLSEVTKFTIQIPV